MCPACLAAAAPVIAGGASGSVALAFVVKKLRDNHWKREKSMGTASPKVVTREEWREARKALLANDFHRGPHGCGRTIPGRAARRRTEAR